MRIGFDYYRRGDSARISAISFKRCRTNHLEPHRSRPTIWLGWWNWRDA